MRRSYTLTVRALQVIRMDEHIHIGLFLPTIATVCLLFLTTLPQSRCAPPQPDNKYSDCIQPFNCGKMHDISYPFWAEKQRPLYCGGIDQFKLSNCDNPDEFPLIRMGPQNFHVLDIDTTAHTMKMLRITEGLHYGDGYGYGYNVCSSPPLTNNSLESSPFHYTQKVHNITIFDDCPPGNYSYGGNNITCPDDGNGHNFTFYGDEETLLQQYQDLHNCGKFIQMQALWEPSGGIDDLNRALEVGFEVKYTIEDARKCDTCMTSNGTCGRKDTATNYEFSCHCPDGSDVSLKCTPSSEKSTNPWNHERKAIVGVAAAVVGTLAVSVAFYFYHRRKKNRYAMSYAQSRRLSSDPSLKDIEKGSQYFGAHIFTYSELEEATNYFDSSRELGDGGFGTVYFGKLQDGRCVAVKRLYENNCRKVEQFMNEVLILTRLRHQNLVSLYGCTSRHSRELLLVYEYIPNGTIADHLHGERAKPGKLHWHIRMKIAVGTASALTYLHASDIIHRDVKTNNILLDNNYCVKVADFGLSRLFPSHVTHISTAPQGTPGYVDPEYHKCYQLTDKSDVYSFGVVLIELISSLPAVDITRHRHEINLAKMAINKIHNQALNELVDPALGFESDYKVRRMINAVAELAFQCLQSSKDMRPSMEEVLDALKDIQSDGKYKSQPEVMDISSDDAVLLKDDPPPLSPDSNALSKSTTPNASG